MRHLHRQDAKTDKTRTDQQLYSNVMLTLISSCRLQTQIHILSSKFVVIAACLQQCQWYWKYSRNDSPVQTDRTDYKHDKGSWTGVHTLSESTGILSDFWWFSRKNRSFWGIFSCFLQLFYVFSLILLKGTICSNQPITTELFPRKILSKHQENTEFHPSPGPLPSTSALQAVTSQPSHTALHQASQISSQPVSQQ